MARSKPDLNSNTRIITSISGVVSSLLITVSVAAPAQATPPPAQSALSATVASSVWFWSDPAAAAERLGEVGYASMFNDEVAAAGVSVYEIVAVEEYVTQYIGQRPLSLFETLPDFRYLHFSRVGDPNSGGSWTVKYIIAGATLPDEFWLIQNSETAGIDTPVVNPQVYSELRLIKWDSLPAVIVKTAPVAVSGVPGSIGFAYAAPLAAA